LTKKKHTTAEQTRYLSRNICRLTNHRPYIGAVSQSSLRLVLSSYSLCYVNQNKFRKWAVDIKVFVKNMEAGN